jgi:PAS domain S-box-containing protein
LVVVGVPNEAVQTTLLGDAVEHAGVGVVVWNEDRRYVAVNPKACELFGTTREQLLAGAVGSTNRSPEAKTAIDAILAHVPAQGATPIRRADGTEVMLEWLVFPTAIAGLDHIVGLCWDRSAL